MEQNLSKECKKVMAEARATVLSSAMNTSMSDTDVENFIMSIKVLNLVDQIIDRFFDMLKKQEELMAKMNKVMDEVMEEVMEE